MKMGVLRLIRTWRKGGQMHIDPSLYFVRHTIKESEESEVARQGVILWVLHGQQTTNLLFRYSRMQWEI